MFLFMGLALVGGVLLAKNTQAERRPDGEPPSLIQGAYLAFVVGVFGGLSQLMSFSAVMLIFILLTGAITAWAALKKIPKTKTADQSYWVEYSRGFFPVILIVFLLRSFLVEPFQIPSSSMRPGLIVGDFILVNKFTYGVRVPILNHVAIPMNTPQRGDVMVFQFPANPSVSFIKRIVGVPGDVVEYTDHHLTVNGKPVQTEQVGHYRYEEGPLTIEGETWKETVHGRSYVTLNHPELPSIERSRVESFPQADACRYSEEGFKCTVPKGQYFALGDNRDHSHDGRYWGFVPDELVVGKAFFIWMNLKEPSRIGQTIQ